MLAAVTHWLSQFHLTSTEATAAGAVATVAAVIVALRAGRQTERLWKRDRDDRQKAHARLVTVVSDLGSGHEPVSEMVIINNSPETILTAGIADVQPRPNGSRVSGQLQIGGGDRPTVGMIRPLDKAEFFIHCLDAEGNHLPWPPGHRRVTIEFMDSHGKCWRRVNYGEPELIKRVKWGPR